MRHDFVGFSIVITLLFAVLGIWVSPGFFWAFVVIVPFVVIGCYDMIQKRHAIMRNFPVFGRGRYLMEDMRPKFYQYFRSEEHTSELQSLMRISYADFCLKQ